ncbi:MAG: 16S rRNA (guanine(527)-N(7))-methyltransferase RsmG [Elusimicrobia bacterium]|nr:16S rRNA (guanine(527)-N(7))-methyltransferase RsmG [Elusimicrobiota bacterium]
MAQTMNASVPQNQIHTDIMHTGAKHNFSINQETAEQLSLFTSLINTHNKSYNLTGFKNSRDIINNLIFDSIIGLSFISFPPDAYVLDIGSGAGIPGIPCALLFPQNPISLIESNQKKLKFLQEVKEKINLPNVTIIPGRAETLAHSTDFREKFDSVLMRAVAELRIIIELGCPFIKNNGHLYAFKGLKINDEIKNSEYALKIMHSKIAGIKWYTLSPTDKQHAIIDIEKINYIDNKYPRKPGLVKKRPL